MARYGSNAIAFMLVDGFSILGDTTELTDAAEDVLEDVTPLGVAVDEWAPVGLTRWTASQVGFFNDAAGRSNAALVEPDGSERVLMYGVQGNAIGKKFTGVLGLQARYSRLPSLAAFTKAEAEYRSAGTVEEGVISHALGSETGDGRSSAPVDNAAQSTGGGAFWIEAVTVTLNGATDVTVKLQDSADDISYADVTGATQDIAARGGWRLPISGTIRRYTETVWAWDGGTNPVIEFTSGVVRA